MKPHDTLRTYHVTLDDYKKIDGTIGISLLLVENYKGKTNSFFYHPYEVKYDIQKSDGFNFTSIFRGLLGIVLLLLISFLLSRNRKEINWSMVVKGLLLQFFIAILI